MGTRQRALAVVLGLVAAGLSTAPLTASVAGAARAPKNHAPGAPRALTVDDDTAPLGVTGTPQFGWQVVDTDPNETQTAYEVVVASTPTTDPVDKTVVWDSGKVASSQQLYVPYGGPALAADSTWYWTVRTWDGSDAEGAFAKPTRFDTGLADSDWQAQWIRRASFTRSAATPEDFTYARKEVTLAASPITRAVAYASASHHYQLSINGKKVDEGPSFSYPDSQYYQSTDVSSALKAGVPNAFGLLYHWYGSGQGRPLAVPGAIAQISIEHADGTRELVTTDGTWRVLAGPWLAGKPRNTEGDFVENIDGRQIPQGWDSPGFNDASWAAATALGRHPVAPWTHLVSQRPRVVEHAVRPVSVKKLPSGAYVADYGVVYAAVPTITFAKGQAGRTIHLHVGYVLDPNGQVSTTKSTQDTDLSYTYIQRDGAQTFRPALYMGFRYLQVDDPGESLVPSSLVIYARHTSVPNENAGTFLSSSKTLNAIWELGRHTALYGSQEQFVDTPTREKGQFLGDAFYSSISDERAYGERDLTHQAILEFAKSQARYWPDGRIQGAEPTGEGARDIPDGTEAFAEWVWQVYLDTGDRDLLATAYPVLANISDYVERYIPTTGPTAGLVTKIAGGGTDYAFGIVDYPVNMRFGYDMNTAARTTLNMQAVDTFRRVAEIAKALGRPAAEIDKQNSRAGALTAAINQKLLRKDGVYVDGLNILGKQSKHASEHANAYALSYGVVPPSSAKSVPVAKYIAKLGMQMGPGTVWDLLRAFDIGGRDADLVKLLSDPKQLGWAQVLAKGGTFVWETWLPLDALGDSMSHTRGAVVLVALQQEILGVRVRDAGWSRFDVVPPTGGLNHASGRVPTPRGPVSVSWTRSGGTVTVRVVVPANAQAVVHVPGRQPVVVGSGTHVIHSS